MVDVWSGKGIRRRRTGKSRRQEPARTIAAETIARLDRNLRETVADAAPDIWEDLTEHGRDVLTGEVGRAFSVDPPQEPLVAVAKVLEAWYRTWLIRQAPGYEEARARAARGEDLGEPVYEFDRLRARLNL